MFQNIQLLLCRLVILGILVGLVFGIDELIKTRMKEVGTSVLNEGVAFGLFGGMQMSLILALLCIFMTYYWIKETDLVMRTGWGMIISGGVSNLLDRWRYGGVVDYIYYPIIEVYGNLADIVIVVGVLVMILVSFRKSTNAN